MTVSATGTNSDLTLQSGDDVTIRAGAESAGSMFFRASGGATSYSFNKSGSSSVAGRLSFESLSTNRTFTFPNNSGTIALTSDTITNAVNATTATNANNINVADETSDTTCFPVFTTSSTGNRGPKTDGTKLNYNASTGLFTATTFSGSGANLTNLPSSALTGALPAIDGSALTGVSAARGGGSDQVFYENDANVTSDYTITAGKNAMSAGPVEIDSGVTVTIPAGSTWTVV